MRHLSRKFLLAAFAELISSIALLLKTIDGGTWIAAITLILGLYGGATVADKKLNGDN